MHTWFDHDRYDVLFHSRSHSFTHVSNSVSGDIRDEMLEGIDKSKIILVFLTETYRDKLLLKDTTDSCRYESAASFIDSFVYLLLQCLEWSLIIQWIKN